MHSFIFVAGSARSVFGLESIAVKIRVFYFRIYGLVLLSVKHVGSLSSYILYSGG